MLVIELLRHAIGSLPIRIDGGWILLRKLGFALCALMVLTTLTNASVGREPSVDELVCKFYERSFEHDGFEDCNSIAEELLQRGIDQRSPVLQARALMRLAYIDISFSKWSDQWESNLAKATELCPDKGTLVDAELLLFRGHLFGKWLRRSEDGMLDLQAATQIASDLRDDVLLSEAHSRLADLNLMGANHERVHKHALLGLRVAEHANHTPAQIRSLQLLILACTNFGLDDLAVPYARKLSEIAPKNQVAVTTLTHVNDQQKHIKKLKLQLRELSATDDLSPLEHERTGHLFRLLALSLREEDPKQAANYLLKAAEHFRLAGNDVNYASTLKTGYAIRLHDGIPLSDNGEFVAMVSNASIPFQPRALVEVVRILEKLGETELAAKWQAKADSAVIDKARNHHEWAIDSANSRWDLELARRETEAELARQNEITRQTRAILVATIICIVVGFLLVYSISSLRSIHRLRNEIRRRTAAQEQSEILNSQLIQTQKLDALGNLSAGVAHDVNNSLQAVLTYAELLKQRLADNDRDYEYVQCILSTVEQASTLTNGLLLFSGETEMQKQVGDLVNVLREMDSFVRHLMPDAITVDTKLSEKPIFCLMNEGLVKQVILNLSINARDAMPEGGKLVFGVAEDADQPEFAILTITDDGNGMSESVQSRIFEPFFTTKDRGSGTGLGMSMAHGIIEDHNGSISVQSALGEGTTVRVLLPTSVPTADKSQQDSLVSYRVDQKHVLLAEDNENIRNAVVTTLEQMGFVVHEAIDGLDALRVCNELDQPLDLLLMDVDLPQLRGEKCVDQLRARGVNAPVVFMTGLPPRKSVAHVVRKPFMQSELVAAIRAVEDGETPSIRIYQGS